MTDKALVQFSMFYSMKPKNL